jgi:hypothetical protein
MPWGWVAVGIAAGFFIGFAAGGVIFILIGHSI